MSEVRITTDVVAAAVAVLEERGWERDDELVQDVRAAIEAAMAAIDDEAAREARHRILDRVRYQVRSERGREAAWRYASMGVKANGRKG